MAQNRGKKFELQVKEDFSKISNVSIDRINDQTTHYRGSTNICDFIVYKKPYEYYIECKSVHGNTLSIHSVPKPDKHGTLHGFYGNISDAQWEGLLEKSKIKGVVAGVLCWWVDKDITRFLSIQDLQLARDFGDKSIRFDEPYLPIFGKKKRVFFEYDFNLFFYAIEKYKRKEESQ